ncbi:hypothetical protein [Actinokineospora sp. NBRC 105648]|uniref:hypothetical protein n=1 Tax=Actinokineospora sp. NBRC 105648 TaxID=3032206 RepID=UPI0024A14075|nr:hypothetical protein [Actinokineospora sp. NBRC 105648]GLZ40117.1 hypothetical protein Acsp05_37410 [Actinokineospora sp. NBRC 105648]
MNINEADTDDQAESTGVCLCPAYSRVPGKRELHNIGAPGCAYAQVDSPNSEKEC